jgi:hypothetical protein
VRERCATAWITILYEVALEQGLLSQAGQSQDPGERKVDDLKQ